MPSRQYFPRPLVVKGNSSGSQFQSGTFSGLVTAQAGVTAQTDQDAGTYVKSVNADASDTGSFAACQVLADTADVRLLAHGTGRTATRYGLALGGYTELLFRTANGLLIGSDTLDKPIVFGINDVEVGRWASSGLTVSAALLRVNHNTAAAETPMPNSQVQIVGIDGQESRVGIDCYGDTAVFTGRRANGTCASPTAALTNDVLLVISGFGRGATGYPSHGSAKIHFMAAENFTDSAQGGYLKFDTTPVGSPATAAVTRWTITAVGDLIATGDMVITGGKELNLKDPSHVAPWSNLNFVGSGGATPWQLATNQATGAGFEINEGVATNNRFYIAPGGAASFGGNSVSMGALTTNGGLQTFGANDTGGAGFRLVLVPNA